MICLAATMSLAWPVHTCRCKIMLLQQHGTGFYRISIKKNPFHVYVPIYLEILLQKIIGTIPPNQGRLATMQPMLLAQDCSGCWDGL